MAEMGTALQGKTQNLLNVTKKVNKINKSEFAIILCHITWRDSLSTVSRLNWNFEVLVLMEGGKLENSGQKPWRKARTNNKLKPI